MKMTAIVKFATKKLFDFRLSISFSFLYTIFFSFHTKIKFKINDNIMIDILSKNHQFFYNILQRKTNEW
jgi:hypothetical protein